MSKKLFPLISVLLIAAFVLAACSAPAATETQAPQPPASEATQPPAAEATEPPAAGEETQPPAAEGETHIVLWHQWSGAYLEAIEEAFRKYEEEHPGVTIDLTVPEDVSNALNVAIPAGEGPDIIGWANDQIGTQALQGNIVPLGELGIDAAFLESTYAPAAVEGVQWDGDIWALPETIEGIALVANTDVVSPDYYPADESDFAGLLDAATRFQADTGKVLVCNQGFSSENAYHVAPVFFGHGVPSYVDEDGNVYLNTPEAIEAAQWLKDISAVSLAENSYDICNAQLAEGGVGMWWTGPWAIAGLEETGVPYEIIPMGRPFVGIKTLMITTNAVDRGNAEVALDIIKYFTSAEVQKELALINKTIPAATAALEDPEVAALPAVSGFGNAIKNGVPMSPSPYSGAQWVPVGRAAVSIYNGSAEPQAAMDEAQAAVEQAVADMQ